MKSLFVVILLELLINHNNILKAQWIQTDGPYGGQINTLAKSGNNIFAGAAFGGGVYRSTDNGLNWIHSSDGIEHMDILMH